jgi:hypothetical protein
MFCNSVRSAGLITEKCNAKFVNIIHVPADLLLQLFCEHNETWGWKSILSNGEINTNSLAVHVRSFISSLSSEFRGALCLAEKWLKHEINHSLPCIVRLRIRPVLPSVRIQSVPSCTGDQQRVYFKLPFKIYSNVRKASFLHVLQRSTFNEKMVFCLLTA